jgi:hypothetical protein
MTEIKGRFVFIPDDGSEAFDIDLSAILEEAAANIAESKWDRFKAFFSKSKPIEAAPAPAPATVINLPELVCKKLEQLFGTAEWRFKDDPDPDACFIVHVFPRNHGEGWEPMVTLTVPGGSTQDLTLGDLITDFTPYEPATEGLH